MQKGRQLEAVCEIVRVEQRGESASHAEATRKRQMEKWKDEKSSDHISEATRSLEYPISGSRISTKH